MDIPRAISYGGFFTLIAVTDQPKLFQVGVDVACRVDNAKTRVGLLAGSWTGLDTPDLAHKSLPNAKSHLVVIAAN